MDVASTRIMVVGAGSIGRRHAQNLRSLGAESLMFVEPDGARVEELVREFSCPVVATMDDAWSWRPNVAVIATPTSLHVEHAVIAAEHDCHLFIEKPIAASLVGVDELLAAVSLVTTLVACNLRFHPGLMAVQRWLDEGAIGSVASLRAEFGQWLPDWRPDRDYRETYSARRDEGGGIILDAIHEFDYVRWLLGDPVDVVCFADHLSSLEVDTEDVAAILLRHADGVIAEIHLDYVQRTYTRTCRVIGDEGTITWDYAAGVARCLRAADSTWDVVENPPGWTPNEMYLDEMRHFLACIGGDEQPAQDAMAGVSALRTALAAARSSERRNVETP